MTNLIGAYGSIKRKDHILENNHPEPESRGYNWWEGYLLCTADDGDTIVLEHDQLNRRAVILRDDFKLLGMPAFHIGDKVIVKKSGKRATVADVTYHFKREEFFYTLDYGDRVSNNWFFDKDIEMAESGEVPRE